MNINRCWISFRFDDAPDGSMHYALAIGASAELAARLFDERAEARFRGDSTTAPLAKVLKAQPYLQELLPEEVLQRARDPMCWTLEYVATLDFNCATASGGIPRRPGRNDDISPFDAAHRSDSTATRRRQAAIRR
ncbi:MAG: hypothetical protein ACREP2_05025 [Rhodanobacteraceae bacterium]